MEGKRKIKKINIKTTLKGYHITNYCSLRQTTWLFISTIQRLNAGLRVLQSHEWFPKQGKTTVCSNRETARFDTKSFRLL